MGIFSCKHKEYKIIDCQRKDKYYICRCQKCGYQFMLPKAIDEMYDIGKVIKLR